MKRCLLVLSGCLLWACSLPADPPDPKAKLPCREPACASYKLDISMTGLEDTVYDAMAELNAWTGRTLYTVDNVVGDCRIIKEGTCTPEAAGGQWRYGPKVIAICPDQNNYALKQLLMHELGHSQGLDHVERGNSIMSPVVSPQSGFTDLDWKECVSKRVCDCRVW